VRLETNTPILHMKGANQGLTLRPFAGRVKEFHPLRFSARHLTHSPLTGSPDTRDVFDGTRVSLHPRPNSAGCARHMKVSH
jgi:hypothetical protein